MSQKAPEEDQQLLQDASTLLMFANAAAGKPAGASPPQENSSTPGKTFQASPTLSPPQPLVMSPPAVSAPSGSSWKTADSQSGSPRAQYQGYPNYWPQTQASIPQTAEALQAHAQAQRQAATSSPNSQASGAPLPRTQSNDASIVKSLATTPPSSQQAPHKVNISSLLDNSAVKSEVPAFKPVAKSSINMFLNEDSPAPVPQRQKSVSPPSSKNVTPQKSHMRSKSSPANASKSIAVPGYPQSADGSQMQIQAGSHPPHHQLQATQAMQGIDLKSNVRSNHNAHIAAQALAVAAEVPLPPKHVTSAEVLSERKHNSGVKEEVTTADSTPPSSAFSGPKVVELPREEKDSGKPTTAGKEPGVETSSVTIPPLEEYRVDPDSGLIGCICGLEDDDGFTIQCDACYRWQHCVCMGYQTPDEVPDDEYKCYYCDPAKQGKFDASKCRDATLQRLADADTSVDKQPSPQKRKPSNSEKNGEANKRRKTGEPSSSGGGGSPGSASSPPQTQATPLVSIYDRLPLKDNPLLTDGVTAESYQSVYFKVTQNDYKNPRVKTEVVAAAVAAASDAECKGSKIDVMTPQGFTAIKLAKVVLASHQKYLNEHQRQLLTKNKRWNKFQVQVRSYSENSKQKFNGINRNALFISSSDADITTIPAGTPVIEYFGEIDKFSHYRDDPLNQYPHWGVPKPQVLRTNVGSQSVVVDARFVGNESRFIRKSCPAAANCRVRPVVVGGGIRFLVETTRDIELASEGASEELRLPWEWDDTHPISQIYATELDVKFDVAVAPGDRAALMSYIDNLLYFCECACATSSAASSCAVARVKKALSQTMRSTRKASGISNVNLARTKEEIIFNRPTKDYVSWDERLVQRDSVIRVELMVQEVPEESSMQESAPKPTGLFAAPYKSLLMAKVKSDKDPASSQSASVANEPPKDGFTQTLFPIVPELANQIEKRIEEKLQPDATTHPSAEAKSSAAEKVPSPVVPKSQLSEQPIVKIEGKGPTAISDPMPEVKPAPKKKLSFADYKKKMK
ncbi:hypothetical protein DICA4_D03312 [Diutina catenulata]